MSKERFAFTVGKLGESAINIALTTDPDLSGVEFSVEDDGLRSGKGRIQVRGECRVNQEEALLRALAGIRHPGTSNVIVGFESPKPHNFHGILIKRIHFRRIGAV